MRKTVHLSSPSFIKRKKKQRCRRIILLLSLGISMVLFIIYIWMGLSQLTMATAHSSFFIVQLVALEAILALLIILNEIQLKKWKFLVSLAVLNYTALLPSTVYQFIVPLELTDGDNQCDANSVFTSYWNCLTNQSTSIQAYSTLSILIILLSLFSMCFSFLYILIQLIKIVTRVYDTNGGYRIRIKHSAPLPKIKPLDWNIESADEERQSKKHSESPCSLLQDKIQLSKRGKWQKQMQEYREEIKESIKQNENIWESYFKLRSQDSLREQIDSILKSSSHGSRAGRFSIRSKTALSHKRLLSFKRYQITVCNICNLLIMVSAALFKPTEAIAMTHCQHQIHQTCLGYKLSDDKRHTPCPLCQKRQ